MTYLFRLVALLVVVLVVGWLAKSQLSGAPPAKATTESSVVVPSGSPQQIQQQYKQALEQAMQPQRSEPKDP